MELQTHSKLPPHPRRKIVQTLWTGVQWLFSIVAVGSGFLWAIPPLRAMLIKIGWLSADGATAVIAGMIVVVFGIAKEISSRSEKIVEELEDLKFNFDKELEELKASFDKDKDIVEGGAYAVYEFINPELDAHKGLDKILEIDILGYTLFSVHTRLSAWLRAGVLRSAVLNLYCLDETFIRGNPALSDDWANHVAQHTRDIEHFKSTHQAELEAHNVEIQIKRFRHLPAVHGFRIGNGALCISLATWHEGKIDAPLECTYERVQSIDNSKHALLLRQLFDNWIRAANFSEQKQLPLARHEFLPGSGNEPVEIQVLAASSESS